MVPVQYVTTWQLQEHHPIPAPTATQTNKGTQILHHN